MPNYDKKGPAGQGQMTGQRLGICPGSQQKNPITSKEKGVCLERGRGSGCCGRGFRRDASMSLDDQEKFLEERLKEVRRMKTNSQN